MVTIKGIQASEILDSRGDPTVETQVILSNEMTASASVPSGASVGKYEAQELRDHDETRFGGMGVLTAVKNVNEVIGPKIRGLDVVKQGQLDQVLIELDGSPNKARLGANAILSVSLAICKAAAATVKLPIYTYISELITGKLPQTIADLPTPTFNIINGGKHGTGNLDFQEFHVIPATIKPYHEALRLGEEVYQQLKGVLTSRNIPHSVGDEGGFTPNFYTNVDALEAIMEAIKVTRYKFGFDIFLGLDVAANEIFKENRYLVKDHPTGMTTEEFIDYLLSIHRDFRLLLLEDPLAEDDWKGWSTLTQKIDREVLIVGDDLVTTNPARLKQAINFHACSGILIKPNQIGTLSETLAVVKQARAADLKIIVSHRSGETNDTLIADLAVGVRADYVKFGAPARGERVVKYNRLLEIERELKLA